MRPPDVLTHFRSDALPAAGSTVGRERELAELLAALDAADAGDGRLFLVAGEPGIGKTRLAEAVADRARERGCTVAWGRCWESGGAPAHWPWVQILRSLTGDANGDGLIRARVPLGSADSDGARFAAWDATASFLAERAPAGSPPLLLVLDDAHAADLPSLLFLRFLSRSLRGRRLLVIATLREAEARTHAELFEELGREGARLPLRGMTDAEVAELVEVHAQRRATTAFVRELRRATDGNPLFALEVLRLRLAEDPADPFRLPVTLPGRLLEMLQRRLAPLPAGAGELLGVAAVAGREFDPGQVARLARVERAEVDAAVAAGTDAGLVEPWRHGHRFTHALVRDALYESLPSDTRKQLHRRLADALVDGGPVAEIAHHYAAAAAPEALAYARAAGDAAAAALAFEDAAAQYERALAQAPEATEACDLLLALGDALMRSGDTAGARTRFTAAADAARDLGEPVRFAAAALGFGSGGETWSNGTVDTELAALLEEALELLPPDTDAPRAMVLARLADVLLYAHDWERTNELTEQAIAAARRSGEPYALMRALEARLLARLRPATLAERAALTDELDRLATESGNPERILGACTWQITLALERNDRRALDTQRARYAAIAEQQRQPNMLWSARLQDATVALIDGRIDDAERLAEEALAVGQTAVPLAQQMFGVQMLAVRAAQGRVSELEPGLRAMKEAFPEVRSWRAAHAVIQRAAGQVDEALPALAAIAREDFLIPPDDYEWLATATMLGEAYARIGDRESCATLYERLLPYAGHGIVVSLGVAYNGCVSRQLALMAAALGRAEDADRHFRDAIAVHERMGAVAFAAITRADYELFLAAPADSAVSLFARDGDGWTLGPPHAPLRLRDAKGLHHLSELIGHPGVELRALDLAGASDTGDAGPALDGAARRAYRERLSELQADLDEAERFHDPERAERIRAERDDLLAELSASTGLRGRDRVNGSASERARVSVTKAIRTTIRRIAELDPALGDYLERSIRTGSACRYDPPARDPIAWVTSLPRK